MLLLSVRPVEYYAKDLKRRHVTKLILWEEIPKEPPDEYHYAQFCKHLERYVQQIDFASATLRCYDTE